MPFPSTKIARQARIVELLQTRRVRSQAELAQYLTDDGMKVTQATLSRDLVEIGAERIRDEGAGLIYAVPNYPARRGGGTAPDARMISLFKELLITAEVRRILRFCALLRVLRSSWLRLLIRAVLKRLWALLPVTIR